MLFERRSISVVPENLWRTTAAGMMTPTGLTITPDTALNVTTVFQAIRFLSFMVASLPLITYQKTGDDRKRATRHPLYVLLHDTPNSEMTSFDMISLMASHVFGRGNGLAEIQFDETGKIVSLWPLRPDTTQLARNENAELRYVVTLPGKFQGEKRALRPEQVWHWRGLTKEGLWGLSVLGMHRNAVGLAKAHEDYSSAYFGNNAEPGVVIKHPGTLSPTAYANITKSWEEAHMGLNQAHRMAILEEGATIEKVGFNPDDSQLLESKKFQVIEIARMFGIPPHLLFELSNATFTNIEHQSLEFVIYHLRPWLVNFEQQIKRSLFLEHERSSGYYAEFLVDGITRGDIATRFSSYSTGLQNGIFTINEVRRLENLNAVDDGDQHFVPLNMTVLGDKDEIEGQEVQLSAMNGAQTESLLSITTQVVAGQLPPDAAKAIIAAAFPSLSTETINGIVDPLASFESDSQEEDPGVPAGDAERSFDVHPLLFDAVERIKKREQNENAGAQKRFSDKPEKFSAWFEEFYERDLPEFMQLVLEPYVRANLITKELVQGFIEFYCSENSFSPYPLDLTSEQLVSRMLGETL